MDDAYLRHWQAQTPAHRAQRGVQLAAAISAGIAAQLRAASPEVSDEVLRWQVACRVYAGDPSALRLLERARPSHAVL